MNRFTQLTLALAAMSVASVTYAVPTVDGSLDAAYGPAITLQTNATGFGDASNGTQSANGSELDGAYGVIDPVSHRLYLMLTGNLETNFNKLNVFIQAHPGGANVIGNSVTTNQGNFQNFVGLHFDTTFAPTDWLSFTAGNATNDVFVDYVNITSNAGSYLGTTTIGGSTSLSGGSGLSSLRLAINNTNTAGVSGIAVGNPGAVATGVELSVDLTELGWNGTDPVQIAAMINGGNNDFLSNQILGGLPASTGNLGGDGAGNYTGGSIGGVNFATFAGDQFFTVTAPVPEPSVLGALALPALLAMRRRH